MTVRENVGLGYVEKMDDDHYIREAAIKGGADEFIRQWKEGYYAMLGATFGGQDLSGGQWQKIAISRGFMPKANLFLLDEPTAALDALAEEQIYHRFQQMTGDETTIMIFHRIGFARLADKIVVMKKGRIVECGTHDELKNQGGEYSKMLKAQQSLYE